MQSLEDDLKEVKTKNEELTKENLKLKEKIQMLETENRMLKHSQPIKLSTSASQPKMDILNSISQANKSKITLAQLKTPSNPVNVNTLKRPFIMLAVFLVFGLNIVQFM